MLISGFKKRSIADQTGVVEFEFNVNSSTTTGNTFVGLSGTQTFGFNFHNSKIYDPKGNLVASYDKDVPTTISGQVGQSSYDYYVNDQIIALGSSWPSGRYSWLYVDTNTSVNFEGFVQGQVPEYSLETTGKYAYQDFVVTGKIVNQNPSSAFRLFDVTIDQQTSPYEISGFTTGDIYNTGYIYLTSNQIGLSDSLVPLILKTNFGNINVNFLVSGDYSVVPDVFLNISPDTTNVVTNIPKHYNVQISNYPSGTQVGISLTYEAGITGNIYFFQEQVSPLTGKALSGLISGQGILESFEYGQVSGLDPKTNIWEIGEGSGSLRTPFIYATGNVSENYEITGYGFGQGALQINYFVSGIANGFFDGDVPLDGGIVPATAYNFLGTGNTPAFGTGYCPTGYGTVFAFPTGCVPLSDPLVYNTDYYSGIVETTKTFTGQLVVPYNVLGVGWATGETFSGTVRTNFATLFDVGLYTFTKFYSGLVSGNVINTGQFDPNRCLAAQPISTGVIVGDYSLSMMLDCLAVTGSLNIPVSGIPDYIYGQGGVLLEANTVVEVIPSGGFEDTETSYDALAGVYTRTKTSRMGVTPSGSGYFKNIVGVCSNTTTRANIANSATDFSFNMWKEEIDTVVTSGQFDSNNNYLSKASFNCEITGTGGSFTSGSGIGALDSGLLHFVISGAGSKTIALKGILPSDVSAGTDRVVELYLYKNGEATNYWGIQGSNFNGTNSEYNSSSPWQKWRTVLEQDIDSSDTVLLLEDLTSGYYSLYAYIQPVVPPVVAFTKAIFSGCESSQYLVMEVGVSGDMLSNVFVELKEWEETTAHSGVNYDPVNFVYKAESLHLTGERKNVYKGGLFFAASNQSYESGYGWQTQQFTVPIYDNAAFGLDHEVYVHLSDPSGATLPSTYVDTNYSTNGKVGIPHTIDENAPQLFSFALMRINENEGGFPTGVFQQVSPVLGYYGTFTGGPSDSVAIFVDGGGNYDYSDIEEQISPIDFGSPANVTAIGVVVTSGLKIGPQIDQDFYCYPVQPIPIPAPPSCWESGNCGGVSFKPSITSPCSSNCPNPEDNCCTCDNLTTTTINCPGYGPMSVEYLAPDARCSSGTVTADCDTDCYVFCGSICMARGATFHDNFVTIHDTPERTNCEYEVLVYDSTCLQITDDDGNEKCPGEGGCPSMPETPDDITSNCDENGNLVSFEDGEGNSIGVSNCNNLSVKKLGKTLPAADGCTKKLIFLKVTCPHDDDETGFCGPTCNPDDEGGGNTCSDGACTTELGAPGQYCGAGGPCFVCKHSWTYDFWTSSAKGQQPRCPPPP